MFTWSPRTRATARAWARAPPSSSSRKLNASLERLKTDHVDCYYLHGLAGDQIELLHDPGVKAAFEALKKQGKTHFCGLSCHDARLPEILEAAVDCGWIDQVMFKFNFRDVGGRDRHDDLQRAIDKATKANLGLVAMKTQGGAINFPDKMADLQAKGFKKEVAAVKTVWMDGRIHVAVSEMTTRSDLRENVAASGDRKLTLCAIRSCSKSIASTTAHLYCHGCGHLCETAAKGVPVATVLRYLRYYEVYGKRAGGPGALPGPSARRPRPRRRRPDAAAEAACPHGLPVVALVKRADRQMRICAREVFAMNRTNDAPARSVRRTGFALGVSRVRARGPGSRGQRSHCPSRRRESCPGGAASTSSRCSTPAGTGRSGRKISPGSPSWDSTSSAAPRLSMLDGSRGLDQAEGGRAEAAGSGRRARREARDPRPAQLPPGPGLHGGQPPEAKSLWTDSEAQDVCALHWGRFARGSRVSPAASSASTCSTSRRTSSPRSIAKVVERMVHAIREHDPGPLDRLRRPRLGAEGADRDSSGWASPRPRGATTRST